MVTEHWVHNDGLRLRVVEDGLPADPCVLFVHGWPDSADLWRNQIPVFVSRGYRVLAIDQRGYGESEIPKAMEDFHVFKAVGDLVAVLDHFSVDAAHIVGHDWGAAVSWLFATFHPDRTKTLVALSVGHPTAFRRAGLKQLRDSFYMMLFQFPGVAEEWLAADDFSNFRTMVNNSPENTRHVANLSRPGRLTASLNWYRANMAPHWLTDPEPDLPAVTVPTLGVIGSDDPVLGISQMELSRQFVSAEFESVVLNDQSHWLPSDSADQLTPLLLGWIATQAAAATKK